MVLPTTKNPHSCVKKKSSKQYVLNNPTPPIFFLVFQSQTPSLGTFFRWFNWIQLMILDRMKSYLWKLELGFWPYSLTNALCPSGSYLVSKPKTPRPRYFLRFNHLIGFTLWFIKLVMFVEIGGRLLLITFSEPSEIL